MILNFYGSRTFTKKDLTLSMGWCIFAQEVDKNGVNPSFPLQFLSDLNIKNLNKPDISDLKDWETDLLQKRFLYNFEN